MLTMRDSFFSYIFEQAKMNSDIIVLTSDFSAPCFDRFRIELPGQFINTGISEQNTILLAAGLSKEGKTVFVTSIAPFITMRCYEQIRLCVADMNLNLKIVAVGAGFSYNAAGPTHHSVEDIGLFRMLPNMTIFSPSCNSCVEHFANLCCTNKGPAYVRLDRMCLSELYKYNLDETGFSIFNRHDTMIISTGYMTHTAVKIGEQTNSGVIDVWRFPINEKILFNELRHAKQLVTIEEHVYQGGLGAYICEILVDNKINLPLKRFALDFSKGFYHRYGTRDEIHDACGIGIQQIAEFLTQKT